MEAPLHGIEVLDVGTMTPGKYCSFMLAELGASVLRIERPPAREGRPSAEDLHLNRGKRSVALDLGDERGRRALHRLAKRADVLIESFRPGVAKRIGIGEDRLRELNPRLVYCSLSGFGQDGPYRDRAAYDLTLLGLSGVLRAFAGTDAPPRLPGTYLADGVSGLVAAIAISSALVERERTGRGRYLDLAMFDSLFSLLSVSHGVAPGAGDAPVAAETSPLYDLYETADGRWLTLAAIRPASCRALFEALERPELAERAWSTGDAAREVRAFLREAFLTGTAGAWLERLGALDIEIGPLRTPAEAFADPQLAARRMVIEVDHPEAGRHCQIGSPFGSRSAAPRPAPSIGADTAAVLAELDEEG